MAKSLEEYLRAARDNGLVAPQQPANIFGNLDNVKGSSDGGGPLAPVKWLIDIVSRPEYAVTGTLVGIDKANQAQRTGKSEGTIFDYLGSAIEGGWKGLTSTDPEDQYTGAEVLERAGVDNDLARGGFGFALDIALDPLTYVTGGMVKAASSGAKSAVRAVTRGGEEAAKSAPTVSRAAEAAAAADKVSSVRRNEFDEALSADDLFGVDVDVPTPKATAGSDFTARADGSAWRTGEAPAARPAAQKTAADDVEAPFMVHFLDEAGQLTSQPAKTAEEAAQLGRILREQYGAKPTPKNAKTVRTPNTYQIVAAGDTTRSYDPRFDPRAGQGPAINASEALPDLAGAERNELVASLVANAPRRRRAKPSRAEDLESLRNVAKAVASSGTWQRAKPLLDRIRQIRETGFAIQPETRGLRVAMIRDWVKQADPSMKLAYRPGLPERSLRDWVKRRNDAAARRAEDESAAQIFKEADEVIQRAFDESELGKTYRESLKGEKAFSDIDTYADAIRVMDDGFRLLEDVLPPNVMSLLVRTLRDDPERFEKLMAHMIAAVGSRPSALRFLQMDDQLRIRMMNAAGIDKVTRSDALNTVARVIKADADTRTGQRLGSTANNVWRKWAERHLKKAKTFKYQTLSGAKTNVPIRGKGEAIYADEINAFGQYDRARLINQYYLTPGARGEQEFLDFVYRRRLDRAGGNTRAIGVSRPKSIKKIYGEERAQAMLEFKIMKYRELDEIDDYYGFRSQLEVGPSNRAAALEDFTDRIPLSIGDVYETLYKSAMGTPLQNAMLRVLGNYQTSVAPTQLLLGIVSRFKGESDEAFDAIVSSAVKRSNNDPLPNNIVSGRRTGTQHYLPKQRAQAAEAARAAGGEVVPTMRDGKVTGYFVQYPSEMLVWELRQVVDQAMPLLRAVAADNAAAFAKRAADEIDFLSSSTLKQLDEVVQKGSDGDLVEAILQRRHDLERLSARHQTTFAARQAALDVQDGLVTLGGENLVPRANRLNLVDSAIDKYLYPAVLDYQRRSNSFGLTGKHGGTRTSTAYTRPSDAEIRAAIKQLADSGNAHALERWTVISRSGRVAKKDRHNPEFAQLAVKIRAEREAKAAREAAAKPKPLSDAEVGAAAKARAEQAEHADRVTRAQHVKEDDEILRELQDEVQGAKEAHIASLSQREGALDAGDAATATAVLEENAEFLDLLGRTSGPRVDRLAGRLLDAFGRMFLKDHRMKTLYPYIFKESQLAGQYVTSMKRKLIEAARLAGVVKNSAIRGSVLPTAFANLQRGLPGGELQAVQDALEDVLRTVLPIDDTNWMSSTFFRNSQKVDEINEYLRANGLKPNDIGRVDGPIFDWEAAVRRADELGTQPADELIQQWRQWKIDDPIDFLSKVTQAAADMNQRKAIAADFHVLAERADWVRDKPEPGFVRIGATGKGSTFGGFIDPDKFYRKEFAEELRAADEMMRAPRQLKNEWLRKYYVPTLNAWKWTITLPRPGHHIRNMIGDWSIQTVARGVRYFSIAQQDAIKILGTNAKYDGADILAALERRPGDPLPKGGDTLVRSEKYGDFTIDELFAALNDQGLRPSYHAAEQLFEDEITKSAYSRLLSKATLVKDTRIGEKIGQFSEYRDHYARAGHFMQALRQEVAAGKHKTREELLNAVGAEVRKYHPDATMLTPFESRYMRNIIPFYSWFRGVLPAIVESSARHPNRVMWFPKASYNLAVANGINPESFANPFPDDQMFPDFISNQVTGPQFRLPDGTYISLNPGIAHLDVFNTLGAGEPEAAVRGVLGMVSPLIRTPAELAGNSRWSTGQPIRDVSDYLDSSIPGINYLSNISGVSTTGSIASLLAGRGLDPQEQVARGVKEPLDQGLSAFNWLSGLGGQNISKENYQRLAQIQERDRALEEYKRGQ